MKKQQPTIGARELSAFISKSTYNITRVAAGIGVPERTLYRWLNGDSRISLYGAAAIEAWTSGTVHEHAWLTEAEADALADIR